MSQWFRHAALSAAVLILCCILVFYFYCAEARLDAVFNSDMLILPQISWNMATRAWGWFMQQQARLIGVFPDQLVYHALARLGLDARAAIPLQAALTLFAEILFAALVIARLAPAGFANRMVAAAVVFIGAPMALALVVPWAPYRDLAMPMNHSGAFVLTLALALRLDARPRDPWTIGLVLVGCFSDTLFLLTGVVPLVVARAAVDFPPLPKLRTALKALPVLFAAIVGLLAQKLVFHQGNVSVSLPAVLRSWRTFLGELVTQPQLAFFVMVGLATMVLVLRALLRMPGTDRRGRIVLLFALGSMAMSLAALMSFYVDVPSLRYAWPLIGWPLILLSFLLAVRIDGGVLVLAGLAGLAVAVVLVTQTGPAPPVLAWRAPDELCVSKLVQEEGLDAGLADFWHARRLVVSSDYALKIEQITGDGAAYLWGNDPHWFFHDWRRPDGIVHYDHILMAGLDRAAILSAFGQPDLIRPCPTTEVWIWRDRDHVGPIMAARSQDVVAHVRPEELGAMPIPSGPPPTP
ncbi:hypothetical protein C3941_22140 [Kaistia algarum]|uniref:hypothetical protein n=1 Tax=Kaistia algarum TaxID=2083279 RepID=UPI000CE780E4|nr:hypothetical protein [Kaistia algarum]MCX5516617.1 hypothetical protein [Kaistia algarum]PPE77749.1 hypothetical protein C3941_22140 [Kaistia algarum]